MDRPGEGLREVAQLWNVASDSARRSTALYEAVDNHMAKAVDTPAAHEAATELSRRLAESKRLAVAYAQQLASAAAQLEAVIDELQAGEQWRSTGEEP